MVAVERVAVGALEIAFRTAGDGVPLLLLHGGACDGRVWRAEVESFAEGFRVVAWDAPGCGASTDAPDDFSMDDYADVLEAFIGTAGLDRPIVVGHSWGSTLALGLAARSHARLRGVVLVGAYAGWAGSLSGDDIDRRVAAALDAADAVESGTWRPGSLPGLFSDVMPPERAAELAECMSEIRSGTTRTMARALATCDLRPALHTIGVPTLIVAGSADRRSPVAVAQALHTAIPGSVLTILPGLGHECFLEDPTAFADAVLPFVRSLGDPSTTH